MKELFQFGKHLSENRKAINNHSINITISFISLKKITKASMSEPKIVTVILCLLNMLLQILVVYFEKNEKWAGAISSYHLSELSVPMNMANSVERSEIFPPAYIMEQKNITLN